MQHIIIQLSELSQSEHIPVTATKIKQQRVTSLPKAPTVPFQITTHHQSNHSLSPPINCVCYLTLYTWKIQDALFCVWFLLLNIMQNSSLILFLSFFCVASFIPQMFTEHLLYAKQYARYCRNNDNDTDAVPAFLELT